MHTWHRECLNSGRQQKVKEVLETAISGFCGLKKKRPCPHTALLESQATHQGQEWALALPRALPERSWALEGVSEQIQAWCDDVPFPVTLGDKVFHL